jgi:hypothetical protein
MKTVVIAPTEFPLFRELAKIAHELFTFSVQNGMVHITADARLLESLGY